VKTSVAPFHVIVTAVTDAVPSPELERRTKLPTAEFPQVNVLVVPVALKSAALSDPERTVRCGWPSWEDVEIG
jgi:hypothetical protein